MCRSAEAPISAATISGSGNAVEVLREDFDISPKVFFKRFFADDAVFSVMDADRAPLGDGTNHALGPWDVSGRREATYQAPTHLPALIASAYVDVRQEHSYRFVTVNGEQHFEFVREIFAKGVPVAESMCVRHAWTVQPTPYGCSLKVTADVIFLAQVPFVGQKCAAKAISDTRGTMDRWIKGARASLLNSSVVPAVLAVPAGEMNVTADEGAFGLFGLVDWAEIFQCCLGANRSRPVDEIGFSSKQSCSNTKGNVSCSVPMQILVDTVAECKTAHEKVAGASDVVRWCDVGSHFLPLVCTLCIIILGVFAADLSLAQLVLLAVMLGFARNVATSANYTFQCKAVRHVCAGFSSAWSVSG